MKTILCFAVVIMISCAHQQLNTPQPGAVQSGISRTQSSLTEAQKQQLEIQRKNTQAQKDLDRIDAKDKFLKGYYKWKSQHP